MYIYLIENTINNHWYIGKRSVSSKSSDFNRYYGSGTRIKKAIIEDGKENFTKTILEECNDLSCLAERELYWLKEYIKIRTLNNCYNILLDSNYVGRNGGFVQLSEHVNKRIESRRKNGTLKWTEESKKRLSEAKTGCPSKLRGRKFKSFSDVKMGSKNPMARKAINIETLEIFNTIKECAEKLNINAQTLYSRIRRKSKLTQYRFYDQAL